MDPLRVGNELSKATLAYLCISTGLGVGVPAGSAYAFLYLGLNALRNFAADLSAKHGSRIREWRDNFKHFKWGKMTDSILVTSLAYVAISAIMPPLTYSVAYWGLPMAVAVPAAMMMIDGSFNTFTRYLRAVL